MTSTEILKVLEQLRVKFTPNQKISQDMAEAWINAFTQDDHRVVFAAVQPCIENEQFFPKIAKFREYMSMESRKLRSVSAPSECPSCDGDGWKESTRVEKAISSQGEFTYPPGVYPCPNCQPAKHERWRSQWIPEARRNKPSAPPVLLPANPVKGLAQARAALAAADKLAKNPEEL